eukprot:3020265-Amphidinium_carterae.1
MIIVSRSQFGSRLPEQTPEPPVWGGGEGGSEEPCCHFPQLFRFEGRVAMANRVVIRRLVQYIIVEGFARSPLRCSHGVVDAARDMSTLVGPGPHKFAFPAAWMNKGTLCMSTSVGP